MCGLIILQSIKVQGYKTVNVNTQQVIEKLYKSILSKPRVEWNFKYHVVNL